MRRCAVGARAPLSAAATVGRCSRRASTCLVQWRMWSSSWMRCGVPTPELSSLRWRACLRDRRSSSRTWAGRGKRRPSVPHAPYARPGTCALPSPRLVRSSPWQSERWLQASRRNSSLGRTRRCCESGTPPLSIAASPQPRCPSLLRRTLLLRCATPTQPARAITKRSACPHPRATQGPVSAGKRFLTHMLRALCPTLSQRPDGRQARRCGAHAVDQC